MVLHRYDLGLALDDLVHETRRAIEGWDWNRGAYGHALSLPAYQDLHPYGRYSYQNFPCAGRLGQLPLLSEIFASLLCEKVSFRLLRRAPASSYAWHTDRWKGPGVVRFQIPILSDPGAFLVLTDYEDEDQVCGEKLAMLTADSFERLARANAGRVRKHHLEPGFLHYFDTTRVHTLVNPGPGERITLSFDLVANPWLRQRFPEIQGEIGNGPDDLLPRPGRLRRGLALVRSSFFPLKNLARQWQHERLSRPRQAPRDAGERQ